MLYRHLKPNSNRFMIKTEERYTKLFTLFRFFHKASVDII